MKQIWTSDDGRMTGTKDEVADYEYQQKNPLAMAIRKVEECYGVKNLFKLYSRQDRGIWEIRGEDPNCDWGGYHHEPYMSTVNGTLAQAIEYAAKSSQFFGWGSGGSIKKINILNL